jgi:hypothetical protein
MAPGVELHGRASLPLAVVVGLCACMAAAEAAMSACDPGLPTSPQDPLAYRQRDDRCEGRYVREVAGSSLVVVSLAEPLPALGSAGDGMLELTWTPSPFKAEVRLRGQSLRRRIYYRMDTLRPSSPATFRWPRALAAALVPRARDLGVLASTAWAVADGARELLLPLRLNGTRADRYELALIPGSEWRELRYTLARVDGQGRVTQTLVEDRALAYGYYPAERAVLLPLPKELLGRSGVFQLDVEAQLDAGGSIVRRLWFMHAEGW